MKIKLNSDWAAPLSFIIATLFIFFISQNGDPKEMLPGINIILIGYASLTGIMIIGAIIGRDVPDGAYYYWWRNVGMDYFAIIGGGLLLAFGGQSLLMPFLKYENFKMALFTFAMGFGLLYLAYIWLCDVRITVFNPDKSIIVMVGRPLTFFRKTYHSSSYHKLIVTCDRLYAGTYGMITTWQRAWYIKAVSDHTGSSLTLYRASSEASAREALDDISKRTGLIKTDLPKVSGPDQTRSVTPG